MSAPDIFINVYGWQEVHTGPRSPDLLWPGWGAEALAILAAVYRRHGRRIAAYTLCKTKAAVASKIDYLGLRRTVRPRADTRGGV